ncbi:MAG TPA: glycosyltransferase [Acidimicrobiales bacterium]|jgi:glycosyltransferase involved in cell wall biosynthesis
MAQVSVIIPTLDRTFLLARSLATVLAQRDVDLEVILIDDGSSPAVTLAPELVGLLSDERIRVLRHDQSKGVAAARNAGIAAATAPWLAFLDDDDLWARDKLAAQLGALAHRPDCSWSYTGEVTLDEDLTVLTVVPGPPGEAIDLLLLQFNAVPGGASSVLAAAEVVRQAGGFDESFSILADWDMWIKLALRASPAAVRDPLVGYFRHRHGMSFKTRRSEEEFGRLEEKYRSVRQARNVELSSASYLRYIADLECRDGRRWSAATHRFQVGGPRPSPQTLALTVATFAAPRTVYRLLDRRKRNGCGAATVEAAQRWVDELPAPPPGTGAQAVVDSDEMDGAGAHDPRSGFVGPER